MFKKIFLASAALAFINSSPVTFADLNSLNHPNRGGGRPGGGGVGYQPLPGHPGHGGGYHPHPGHPGHGGGHQPQPRPQPGHPGHGGGYQPPRPYPGYGNGRVSNPTHIPACHTPPYGGWRGNPHYYNGVTYYAWSWNTQAPWYNWAPYTGWRLGLGYYIPEGVKCYADNPYVAGEWSSYTSYYSSDEAVGSALGLCESDPYVVANQAQYYCRIRTCVRW